MYRGDSVLLIAVITTQCDFRSIAIRPCYDRSAVVEWTADSRNLARLFFRPHTHTVLTAIFLGEPGLAGCPLNSPSPFIPGLRILLGQT